MDEDLDLLRSEIDHEVFRYFGKVRNDERLEGESAVGLSEGTEKRLRNRAAVVPVRDWSANVYFQVAFITSLLQLPKSRMSWSFPCYWHGLFHDVRHVKQGGTSHSIHTILGNVEGSPEPIIREPSAMVLVAP